MNLFVLKHQLLLLIIISMIYSPKVFAHGVKPVGKYEVFVVASPFTDGGRAIVDIVSRELHAPVISNTQISISKESSQRGILVAVGPAACRAILSIAHNAISICSFTSSYSYRSIVAELERGSNSKTRTAVYADPNIEDQFRLIKILFKKPVSVGILVSEKNDFLRQQLHTSKEKADIQLNLIQTKQGEINFALDKMGNARVLLAIPDAQIYTGANIRNLFLTTFHRNQSVIGFSNALVSAGALATVSSDANDIVAQIKEIIEHINATDNVPPPKFPKYFSVTINSSVAKSLEITINESAIKQMENRPK